MNKKDVIEFFDRLAPNWDADMVKSDEIIGTILDNAGVSEGKDVLDVACGTGVLIPYYYDRRVASVTAIDISPKMAEIASSKYSGTAETDKNTVIICGDAEEYRFDRKFDSIVIYNAFPHFVNPEGIIAKLSNDLKPGGTLTVAHGMSREAIDRHHNCVPTDVSANLPEACELAKVFAKYLTVKTVISDDRMYQVAGFRA